jgi:hypothetical protein
LQDLRHIVGLLTLVFVKQGVELLEFGGEVGFLLM